MNSEKRALGRALREQAERLDATGPRLDDVLGRAGRIRRRRRIASGLAAAATVVVLAPGALWAADTLRADTSVVPPATNPTQSIEPSPEVEPSPAVETSEDPAPEEPGSAAPRVAYFDYPSQTAHRPDGTSVRVDMNANLFSFAALADGRLVFVASQDSSEEPPVAEVVVFDADGTVTGRWDAWGYGLTASADGRMVAWIGEAGTPMVLQAGRSDPLELDPMTQVADASIEPVQVRGDCADDAGCTVYAVDSSTDPTIWESSNVFPAGRYAGDGGLAVAPDGRYFLEIMSANDDEICVGLWDRDQIGGDADPDPLGEECIFGLLGPTYEFSPSGRWIVAQHGEGYGATSTEILDGRTLEVVASVSEEGATYHDAAWEGDESVVLVVDYDQQGLESGEYELQRLGVDGSHEKLGISANHLAK